jgi:hypothetical protein
MRRDGPPAQTIDPVSRVKQKEIAASMRGGGPSTDVSQYTAIECPSVTGFITSPIDGQRTCQDLPLRSSGSVAAAILDVQCSFAQLLSNDGYGQRDQPRGAAFAVLDRPTIIGACVDPDQQRPIGLGGALDLDQSLLLPGAPSLNIRCRRVPTGKQRCHCRSKRFFCVPARSRTAGDPAPGRQRSRQGKII